MKMKTIGILVLCAATFAHAKSVKKLTRKIASVPKLEIMARIGESRRSFLLEKKAGKYELFVSSAEGSKRTNLKDEDAQFIFTEFEKLPVAVQIPKECARSRVDIVAVGKTTQSKASCLGMKTITTAPYNRFLGILNLAM